MEIADFLGVSDASVHSAGSKGSSIKAKWAVIRRAMTPDLKATRDWPIGSRYAHFLVPLVERNLWVGKFKAIDNGEDPVVVTEDPATEELTVDELRLEVHLYKEALQDRDEKIVEMKKKADAQRKKLEARDTKIEKLEVRITNQSLLVGADTELAASLEAAEKRAAHHEEDARKAREALRNLDQEFRSASPETSGALQAAQERIIGTVLSLREGMKYDDEKQTAYITMSGWVEFQNALINYYRNGGK